VSPRHQPALAVLGASLQGPACLIADRSGDVRPVSLSAFSPQWSVYQPEINPSLHTRRPHLQMWQPASLGAALSRCNTHYRQVCSFTRLTTAGVTVYSHLLASLRSLKPDINKTLLHHRDPSPPHSTVCKKTSLSRSASSHFLLFISHLFPPFLSHDTNDTTQTYLAKQCLSLLLVNSPLCDVPVSRLEVCCPLKSLFHVVKRAVP